MAFVEIGKQIGISDATVHLRVRRLISEGVITKFTISVDNDLLGYDHLAFIGINIKPGFAVSSCVAPMQAFAVSSKSRALTTIKTLSIITMDFDEVVKRRKMIRGYDLNKQHIPDQIITKLIKNAHRAPSAGRTQVQEFIIVKSASTKKKLRKAAVNQEYVETAPLLIVVCSNTSRSVGRYGSRGREFYSIIDGAFASMLILLSAINDGIGACFVGAFQDNKVSEILELPKDVRPIGIICIGYPAEKPEKFQRIDVKALVHYQKYGRSDSGVLQ